jgi:type II secretory pathway pseudopilin PulG
MWGLQRKNGERPRLVGPIGSRRRGLSAAEVIVIAAIVSVIALCAVMALPRRRETARLAACRKNLMQIGQALALYDQSVGHLPTVPELGSGVNGPRDSPLKALLDERSLPDLTEVTSAETPPPKPPNPLRGERREPGFVCPSDPNATSALFPASISYRATAGDAPDGRSGAFAPGRRVKLATIEAADGLGYTAAFAERLVGNGRNAPDLGNYALALGPIAETGCPSLDPAAWRGDAGSSWVVSDWKSTLYNHVQPPGASPSCLADDGRTASMGASSGHVPGVNVLIFDGSVRTMTPQIDLKIWREWAAFPEPAPSAPTNPDREE